MDDGVRCLRRLAHADNLVGWNAAILWAQQDPTSAVEVADVLQKLVVNPPQYVAENGRRAIASSIKTALESSQARCAQTKRLPGGRKVRLRDTIPEPENTQRHCRPRHPVRPPKRGALSSQPVRPTRSMGWRPQDGSWSDTGCRTTFARSFSAESLAGCVRRISRGSKMHSAKGEGKQRPPTADPPGGDRRVPDLRNLASDDREPGEMTANAKAAVTGPVSDPCKTDLAGDGAQLPHRSRLRGPAQLSSAGWDSHRRRRPSSC